MEEARIGFNYLVSTKSFDGNWKNEYFVSEKAAEEYANDCFNNSSEIVEFYVRKRVGYGLIERKQQTKEESHRKYVESIQRKAKELGCVVNWG